MFPECVSCFLVQLTQFIDRDVIPHQQEQGKQTHCQGRGSVADVVYVSGGQLGAPVVDLLHLPPVSAIYTDVK